MSEKRIRFLQIKYHHDEWRRLTGLLTRALNEETDMQYLGRNSVKGELQVPRHEASKNDTENRHLGIIKESGEAEIRVER